MRSRMCSCMPQIKDSLWHDEENLKNNTKRTIRWQHIMVETITNGVMQFNNLLIDVTVATEKKRDSNKIISINVMLLL